MPLWMRLLALTLALALVTYIGLSTLRLKNSLSADSTAEAQAQLNQTRLMTAQTNTTLSTARIALMAAQTQLAAHPDDTLLAAELARKYGGPVLQSVTIVKSSGARDVPGTALATSGDPDADLAIKAATTAHDRLSIVAAASSLSGGARTLMVLKGDDKTPDIVARLNDQALTATKGLSALVDSDGLIVAATDDHLTGQPLKTALAISYNQLKARAESGDLIQGARAEGGFLRIAAAMPDTADTQGLILLTAQPTAAFFSPRESLIRSATFVGGPLIIGALFALLLMIQAQRGRKAAREFEVNEQRYRLAVEAARCGIWDWDLEQNLIYMSDVTGVMLGWGGGGVATTQEVLDRIAPEHRNAVINALEAARFKGALDVSFRVPRANGQSLWVDARGQAVGNRTVQGFTRINGVALDVTEERIAQSRAQRAEARLLDAINSVSDAFVLWDRRQRLLMWNKTFGATFNIDERFLRPGTPRPLIDQVMQIAIRRKIAAPDGREGVFEAELNDGRWIHISESRTLEGGRVLTGTDITAVKIQEELSRKNEEQLQAMVEKLEQSRQQQTVLARKYEMAKIRAEAANHSKSEFLANMSHELRTPLNAINGFSEIMAGEMFGPLGHARYKEYAGDILNSGQHLLSLINDILDMSKIESGKMTLRFEPVAIDEVVEDTLRLVRQRAEKAGLKIRVHLPQSLPEIEADFRALKQVLINLMTNAVKFTPQGGTITVSAVQTDINVHVRVTDTGIGIAEKDKERLAKPFEQIENQFSKTKEGTGLGLALTKSLIEMHNGRMDVDSQLGQGTTVEVTLPIHQPVKSTEPRAQQPKPDANAA